MIVGCCGWGFFAPKTFFGSAWKERFKSRLGAYSSLYDVVEVDSTFYSLPKIETAERWREEVPEGFEFVVKAPKSITHEKKFGKGSLDDFNSLMKIAKALRSDKILFQTPASFGYSKENEILVKRFFGSIKSKSYSIIWEPRGTWLENAGRIEKIAKTAIICTDPLRNFIGIRQKFYYFRLHGFGAHMIYSYKFSDSELKRVSKLVEGIAGEEIYIMFNNTYMYEDALRFEKINYIRSKPIRS
ncbi:MAG: DUF72 domain-containing protein [Candidatus Micrarchaeia archaeon]